MPRKSPVASWATLEYFLWSKMSHSSLGISAAIWQSFKTQSMLIWVCSTPGSTAKHPFIARKVMHFLEGPVKNTLLKRKEEEKSPTFSCIWTLDLMITRNVIYLCATTVARSTDFWWTILFFCNNSQIFWGHESDINSVCFHPGGNNFVTCSEDKTAR